MLEFKTIPDADLSSAGDDFHLLWAIKKSLDLLNFDDDGLKAVIIEGVEENASKKIDPTGEKFLGIDLTEYYGGIDFETANSVVISQLKYSTRRANESFTYSKLYNGKKSKKGSIVHRLATIFKVFLDEYGRDEVIKKTTIKLVSNRGINTTHLNQFNQIKRFLHKNKRPQSFNAVLNKLPNISRKPFDELRKASDLNLKEFTDFIRLLDFEDCGADSRQKLNFELIKSISNCSGHSSLAGGQYSDLTFENKKISKNNIIDMQKKKTGKLFGFCCESIAIIKMGNKKKRKLLKEIGLQIGLLFQIVDDLIDYKGDSNIVGKPTGSDKKKGKATLVNLLGYDETLKFTKILKRKLESKIESYGSKADDLLESIEFILKREF
mgnify:CR=1 FL=1